MKRTAYRIGLHVNARKINQEKITEREATELAEIIREKAKELGIDATAQIRMIGFEAPVRETYHTRQGIY